MTPEEFWARVNRSGGPNACWPWVGWRNQRRGRQTYGRLHYGGRKRLAHHVAFILKHGREPIGVLRHTCDNEPCCNEAHLLEGTTQDNVDDRTRRGRTAVGARLRVAKLSPELLRRARRLRADGLSYPKIGLALGVDNSTIWRALNGGTWRWVQ